MVPSWAVTSTVIGVKPTAKGMAALGDPETMVAPLTLTVALICARVGVSVRDVVALETLAV